MPTRPLHMPSWTRTRHAQRRHDALAEILMAAAGCEGPPGLGGAPATLLLSVAPDQLGDVEGVSFLHGAHRGDHGVVSAGVARQVAGRSASVPVFPG
ncbi:MAG: hypothetical protein L0L69_03325 [Propionibacterium sp.]|nr:hypothetical protein [Propionibacterium sp.]